MLQGNELMDALYVLTGHKLSHSTRLARHLARITASALAAALLGACAATPADPLSEKLDPDTATTVTVLNRPIELFSQNGGGNVNDPFAYIAPFETNRQGERALYLWVSAPQLDGVLTQPQVLCNGQPLALQPLSDGGPTANPGAPAAATGGTQAKKIDWSQMSLSRAPYDAPVPWSVQWYFRLPQDGLNCLAGAEGISVATRAPDGDEKRFNAARKNLASLDAFTRR
jgi:hypothetical protein